MKPERKRMMSETNNNSPSWRQAEFKGSPRQVYGGQGCKSGTESSSHPICGERGAMNLPFGNASAIKHHREGVQCSWAKRAQETGLAVGIQPGAGRGAAWLWESLMTLHNHFLPSRPPNALAPCSSMRSHLGPALPRLSTERVGRARS